LGIPSEEKCCVLWAYVRDFRLFVLFFEQGVQMSERPSGRVRLRSKRKIGNVSWQREQVFRRFVFIYDLYDNGAGLFKVILFLIFGSEFWVVLGGKSDSTLIFGLKI
jgi:hypothetical protein